MVPLETMAAGLPIVNADIDSGVPEISRNGITGLTVPPGEDEALGRAIQLLLERDELRRELGRAARVRAELQPVGWLNACWSLARKRPVAASAVRARGLTNKAGASASPPLIFARLRRANQSSSPLPEAGADGEAAASAFQLGICSPRRLRTK